MTQINWDLLVQAHTEHGVKKTALAFVIRYHDFAFIARRRPGDFVAGCYELPVGLMEDNETVLGATRRILAKHYKVELQEIEQFLNSFTYRSAHGVQTQMFVFSLTVTNPFSISLDRNDHGVWLQAKDLNHWPIMTQFKESLLFFWFGESFSYPLAMTLVEQGKREGFWRQKVRAVVYRSDEILLLKRARRNKTLPLYYELPGKEIDSSTQIDSALVACVTDQTGWAPDHLTRFLGYYDYFSELSQSYVREFIYAVHAQNQVVKLSEHAYFVWKSDLDHKALSVTPCAKLGFELFKQKFFLNLNEVVQPPAPVYYSPQPSEEDKAHDRYFTAMKQYELEGKLNIQALKGHPLMKRAIPKEFHKALDLE